MCETTCTSCCASLLWEISSADARSSSLASSTAALSTGGSHLCCVCVCVCKQQFSGLVNGCTIDWWVPPLVCVCLCVCEQQFPGLVNGCTIDWWVPPLVCVRVCVYVCVCVCVQAAVPWPHQQLHYRLVGPTFGVCMFVYVCVRVCVCVCEQQFPGLVNGCTIDWWVPPLVCVCVCKQQFPGLINGCTIDWWVPPLVCVCACVCVRLRAAVPGL